MMTANELIKQLSLQPHPEGGWFKETYRSAGEIDSTSLSENFSGSRNLSTAIYFLLEQGNFSALHRIKSDECWHFYAGDMLEVFVLHHDGRLEIIPLGNDWGKGECFQYVVPANTWFASRPGANTSFSLVGCTVSPGFDFNDFEMAKADDLTRQFPEHEEIIRSLCRQ